MSVQRERQPSHFQCATCGASVDFVTETRRTAQSPITFRSYECSADRGHDVGELVVPGMDDE